MPSALRQLLGRAKTACYRRPKDELGRMLRWGPRAYFRCDAWAGQMEEAARTLPIPASDPAKTRYDLWFLTGRRFWYQTAFCAWSYARHSRHAIRPVILDDGSLDEPSIAGLRRLFPELIVHSRSDCRERFMARFPLERFPHIHRWREKQILFRKLTDIHGDSQEWRVFFDSDMLIHREPRAIDDYFANPSGCLAQTDCWESYGYSRSLTERLCGHRLPDAVNIGIFSLKGDRIDWEKVEFWLSRMEAEEGTRYNVTQCTSAMLMAGQAICQLDREDYKVWPASPPRGEAPRILEHYVADSKPWYFGRAWKSALASV